MIPAKNPVQKSGSAIQNRWSVLSRATCSWRFPGLFAMVWNGFGMVLAWFPTSLECWDHPNQRRSHVCLLGSPRESVPSRIIFKMIIICSESQNRSWFCGIFGKFLLWVCQAVIFLTESISDSSTVFRTRRRVLVEFCWLPECFDDLFV